MLLTEGIPVYIAFTSEWFKQNIDLPELNIDDFSELTEGELKNARGEFQFRLIDRVRTAIHEPLNKALLYMALLDRRFDTRILQIVLGYPDEQLDEIQSIAKDMGEMAFVRTFLLNAMTIGQNNEIDVYVEERGGILHDEAKRLIKEYAWPRFDHDGQEEAAILRRVIKQYYQPQIHKLRQEITKEDVADIDKHQAKQKAQQLELECYGYSLMLSVDQGRHYLTDMLENRSFSKSKLQGILHEIDRTDADLDKNLEQDVSRVRYQIHRRKFENIDDNSLEKLKTEFENEQNPPWYRSQLALEYSDAISIDRQLNYLQQELTLAQERKDTNQISKAYNELGLYYRKHRSNWVKAGENFQKALEYNTSKLQRASTQNNLAFVQLLLGELSKARATAHAAEKSRRELGSEFHIGLSLSTLGQIYEALGNDHKAIECFRNAAILFKQNLADKDYNRMQVFLSEEERRLGKMEDSLIMLKSAIESTDPDIKGRALRKRGSWHRIMADNNAPEKKEHYDKAEKNFKSSLEVCKENNNRFGQAQALLKLCHLSYTQSHNIDSTYREEIKPFLNQFPIISAQYDELTADYQFRQGEIEGAWSAYIKSANIYERYHRRKYTAIIDKLTEIVLNLKPDTQRKLTNLIQEQLNDSNNQISDVLKRDLEALEVQLNTSTGTSL